MKREIKFRGKSKNGVFKFGSYHNIIGKTIINNIEKHLDLHFILETNMPDYSGWYLQDSYKENAIEKNTLGQLTGLRDKNGLDIYEGDIMQWDSGEIGVVKYEVNGCQFRIEVSNGVSCHIGLNISGKGTAVVIGNIHENTELLK